MATKKYVSLSKLSTFLSKLKTTFAAISHTHKISDLTDYTVDSALSSTSTNPIQNKVLNEEFEAIATAMNALESDIDSKQATITGAATTITSNNLTASRALISNSSGKVAVSDVTSTELGYLDGVSSNIQTQLNAKAATSHGTHVTYSTTAPVMDGTASVGTASTVARSDHKHPTDTSRASQSDLDALKTTVAGKADSSHTHSAATTSAAGLMSASDKSKLDGIASGANAYSLPTATSSTLGGVKTGSNITNSSGTISITKDNVTAALGYTPPTTNTTYTSLKNPYAVTIQANGTSLGTYDGSNAKTFNITASNVGADVNGAADSALASAKSYADQAASEAELQAKHYADDVVANKTLVQIITWEDDD